jgi:hypothetical protein
VTWRRVEGDDGARSVRGGRKGRVGWRGPGGPTGLLGWLEGLGQMANGPVKGEKRKYKLNFEIDF